MRKKYLQLFFLMVMFFCVLTEGNAFALTFPDIKHHWAKSEIEMLLNEGIIEGRTNSIGKKLFYPDAKITRAEFVVMLVNAMHLKPHKPLYCSYEDISGHWAQAFIEAATEANITGGVGDGMFLPDKEITRAEIVVMIARAKKLPNKSINEMQFVDVDNSYWFANTVLVAKHYGLVSGDDDNKFRPFANATRAETAAMVARLLYM